MYWSQNIHDKLGEKRKPQLLYNLLLENNYSYKCMGRSLKDIWQTAKNIWVTSLE